MTILFRRIKPAQKFRITKRQIAKLLRISESLIVKIESWLFVVFVHRTDKGGQFISYRQIEQWKNAVACQVQKCLTQEQLQHLWNAITFDHTKHQQQYADSVLPFMKKILAKCQEAISKKSQNSNPLLKIPSHHTVPQGDRMDAPHRLNRPYHSNSDIHCKVCFALTFPAKHPNLFEQ